MNGETNLNVLISTMKPKLNEGEFVFCSSKTIKIDIAHCLFFFKENEGITFVCAKSYADKKKYAYSSVFSWITLEVHSALEAVGLTAAFSQALAKHDISCNVVAGYYHDHIFVQRDRGVEAVKVLEELTASN
ncbi:MAG: ACT domain-containing protein [Saprospiraceae bacterium]|nr:ACT domain-containing protein [Saprospiraceae bacterium]